MQIIVVTAKIQISLRVLSVESQASLLYYIRDGCRQSAQLTFICEKVHLMRPQTQTDHSECSNRKPFDFEDRNLQSEFGHKGRIGLYMYQEK